MTLLGALAALAACEHAQPFGAADLGVNAPFDTSLPRRLTFSDGGDVAPAWLPDGSRIIYSFRLDRPDHDRCLGILPAEGGHIVQTICHRPYLNADSTNALWSPAVSPGGLLAYVRESSVPGSLAPNTKDLVVASLDAGDPGRVALPLPHTLPDGQLQRSLSHLHWLDDRTLVYLAEDVAYLYPPPDTVVTPLEIVRLTLAGDSATAEVLPGTAGASSVAVDSAGAIYFTLRGDTRVYRLSPGAGARSVFYDFASTGFPSDVQVRGTVLIAVVGTGLWRADLKTGTAVPIGPPDSLLLLHPALSPSGLRVVAEAYGRSGLADLWLLQVP